MMYSPTVLDSQPATKVSTNRKLTKRRNNDGRSFKLLASSTKQEKVPLGTLSSREDNGQPAQEEIEESNSTRENNEQVVQERGNTPHAPRREEEPRPLRVQQLIVPLTAHMFLNSLRLLIFLGLSISFLVMTDVVLDVSDVSGNITPHPVFSKPSNFSGLPRSFTLPALKTWFQQCRASIKPWGLFISTTHYKVPPSVPRLLKRAVNNLSYFQGNYLTITLILMAYCLLTSPMLLLAVAASLIACYMLSVKNIERKLVISGKEISLNQQYAAVGICSLPLYYWAGVGQAVFWVIGASCFVISIHAGLFNIDEVLSQEDQMDLLVQQI